MIPYGEKYSHRDWRVGQGPCPYGEGLGFISLCFKWNQDTESYSIMFLLGIIVFETGEP